MKDIANQVDSIFMDSLFNDEELQLGETPDNAILVEGIINNYGFHKERLNSHKDEISNILNLMPDDFHQGKGGGMSFLNLCMDKDGNQWGEHRNMEQLVVLAIATDQGKYSMPKAMWPSLPGAVPYVTFITE